ncbi:NADP-dependent oxidoreductase [Paramicrobacterium agarici]|uniref:NADP-dependent oxidoreductase n=1 Tax=Paramicrobacterium agarici TaxID=630514 RepID=UPI00116E56EE|nr:NADP-dependent oxidoreductase [Microbacterium agarici]TQO22140.1 NADPH:quinone reductase-like Zn-dependent oxidoreductase [Microbacterium agarici]
MTESAPVPESMTAIVIDEPGPATALRAATVPVPPTYIGEVLVKVAAASVNPIDTKIRSGVSPTSKALDYPAVLGHDFSGTIARAPYEAHPLSDGTEVYGMTRLPRYSGSHAEYVSAPTLCVAPKPQTLSHVEAASAPLAALTAWGAVVDVARAHHGQRILIHAGAGGVGQFAVQFARFFGAEVISTASEDNLEFVRSLGASTVIDYRATRFDDELSDVDVVIDLIGNVSDDTGSRSLRVLRNGGLYINVPTGSFPTMADEADSAGVRATRFTLTPSGEVLAKITRLIDQGEVRVHIDKTFDLMDAADAHAAVETGHTRGKVVLTLATS